MNLEYEIREITISDPLYQDERILRNEVLLRPIGIPDFGWEQADSKSHHFLALDGDKVIGCVLLNPYESDGKNVAQLLQMAVLPEFQRLGIGGILVETIFKKARELNIKEIYCHARVEVTDFYEKMSFVSFGGPFFEVGQEHRNMKCIFFKNAV